MKIFLTSLPFDKENSGDYDYCTSLTSAVNEVGSATDVTSNYITSLMVPGYDPVSAGYLLDSIRGKNIGGKEFYDSLNAFYQNAERKVLVSKVFEYITSSSVVDPTQNIFNLQLRAPETGFLFSPEDLDYIRGEGFKVVVTCHEYELNYSRKWLQTVCHPYFIKADKVLFFSEQDMISANAHAGRSIFLDEIFKLSKLPGSQIMLSSFSSKAHSHMYKRKEAEEDDEAILVTNQELSSLDCNTLVGSISFTRGVPIRFKFDDHGIVLPEGGQFKLEFGVRANVQIPKQPKPFSVSGIIINPKHTPELQAVKEKTNSEFNFSNHSYNLESKSTLTKVAPTTATQIFTSEAALDKPSNIVIFGLIREGKGFEDALSIIQMIHNKHKTALPDTRLIIVGKPSSLKLLSSLLNTKFGLKDIITEEMLGELNNFRGNAGEIKQKIDEIIENIRERKLYEIKSALVKVGVYSEGIECLVLNQTMSVKIPSSKKMPLSAPCKLQLLADELMHVIPELLPIDFVLDASKDDLPSVFAQAKYAIKYDEKGWANNASGLINMLAYGCVLYAGYGMCTEDEVVLGQYKGALVLPKGRYCLMDGESFSLEEEVEYKRQHFKPEKGKLPIEIASKVRYISEKDVIADIIAREQRQKGCLTTDYVNEALDSSADNVLTFSAASALLHDKFDSVRIAGDMIECFTSLFSE